MYERVESELLGDQRKFISLNATLMYASKRTYPEISFPVTYLSSRYNRATGVAFPVRMFSIRCVRLSYDLQ